MTVKKELLSHVPASGIVLVVGATGSGKSCLAYGILEELHKASPSRATYVFGLPKEKSPLLPEWLSVIDALEFPEESIVLADEAYLSFYSRTFMSERNRFMDTFSGLARQKDILALYITQATRKLDIALVSGAQLLLIKRPSLLMVKLDRSELRHVLAQALDSFLQHPRSWRRCTYVFAETYEGLVKNSNTPPTFWCDDLSKAWKGVQVKKNGESLSVSTYQDKKILCLLCIAPAEAVCSCHGNSYCKDHLDGHQEAEKRDAGEASSLTSSSRGPA